MFHPMSVAEIKAAIDRLKPKEQEEISRHLRRLQWGATPERRRELAEIMDEMDAGKKIPLDELKRRHDAREAKSA